MEKRYKPKERFCMNCKGYNLQYGYCNNKESDFYQLEMGYKEVCSEHKEKDMGGRWSE